MIDISRALTIPGWMSPTELTWLAEQAQTHPTIIEIGCYQGRTTRVLGDHVPEGGCVYAVDPWDGYANNDNSQASWILIPAAPTWEDIYAAWCYHVEDLLASGKVRCIRTTSDDVGRRLTSDGRFDLVFLDGDHREAIVADEIARFRQCLRNGGILAGHDYTHRDWPGVKAAVDAAFPEGVNQVDSIWWVQL